MLVTDDDLKPYVGLLVETRLTSGETLLGRLIRDGGGSEYAIQQSSSNPDQGATLIAIGPAASIETLRSVSAPPEMLD